MEHPETVIISGRVPKEVRAQLNRVAQEQGVKVGTLVVRAVTLALKRWAKPTNMKGPK
jgi:predicted HicB family RNase H-like nuclease